MYWNQCEIEFLNKNDKLYVKFIGRDVFTNEPYSVYIPKENYEQLVAGKGINESLKGCDFSIKNFLANGIAPKNQSVLINKRKVISKAYVTNATANSIAFYAWLYKRRCQGKETGFNEIKKSFLKQSEQFLVLYNDQILNSAQFVQRIELNDSKKFLNGININEAQKYFRKVYHIDMECEFLHSDYEKDDLYFKNTGVFFENKILTGSTYYILDEKYLKELGMRKCKKCASLYK